MLLAVVEHTFLNFGETPRKPGRCLKGQISTSKSSGASFVTPPDEMMDIRNPATRAETTKEMDETNKPNHAGKIRNICQQFRHWRTLKSGALKILPISETAENSEQENVQGVEINLVKQNNDGQIPAAPEGVRKFYRRRSHLADQFQEGPRWQEKDKYAHQQWIKTCTSEWTWMNL